MNDNEKVRYEYFRSVDKVLRGDTELFLGYVSLVKYKLEYNENLNSDFRKRYVVKDLALVEDITKVNPLLLQLPQEDVTYDLTEFQFSELIKLYEEQPISIWLYLTSISN